MEVGKRGGLALVNKGSKEKRNNTKSRKKSISLATIAIASGYYFFVFENVNNIPTRLLSKLLGQLLFC